MRSYQSVSAVSLCLLLIACGARSTLDTLSTGLGGSQAFGGNTGVGGTHSGGGTKSLGGNPGTGGIGATGGKWAPGGATATGGKTSTGGTTATGGAIPTGGRTSTGGTTTTGGAIPTGGRTSTGGTTTTGGAIATGGNPSAGGTQATGGMAATGGTSATGGSSPAGGGTNTGGAGGQGGAATTILEVKAGRFHTCALLSTGAVRCWGNAAAGALGYGNTNDIGDDETPASAGDVNVGGIVRHLAVGMTHTCALLTTGSVRCWGSSTVVGYGNTNNIGDDETPASAGDVNIGGLVAEVQTSSLSLHTCARLTDETVRCWGFSSEYQLGYPSTDPIGDDETPASAGNVNIGGPVKQLATGISHTCALLTTGTVRCWGWGANGLLGYANTNTIGDNESPASAGDVDVGGVVTQIAAGGTHTCALLTTGVVRCWGGGVSGELGYGNTSDIGDNETPASVGNVDVGGEVIQISAGSEHTCALLATGAVRCWGYGHHGTLGYGNTNNIGDDETPASAGDVNVGGRVVEITAGSEQTCALLETGTVRCWGSGSYGELGYGNMQNIGDDETPASAGDVPIL